MIDNSDIANKFLSSEEVASGDIPEGVKCVASYEKYLTYKKKYESLIAVGARIKTSVAGVVINIKSNEKSFNHFKKFIPEPEFEKYAKMRKEMLSIKGKMNFNYRKSYGISVGFASSHGDRSPELSQSVLGTRFPEVIDLFGRYYTIKEIHELIVSKWGIEMSVGSVESIYKNNIDEIKRRRDAYAKDYSNVRLGHKRSRLDELSYMYKVRKEIFDTTGKKISDSAEMRKILEQIRKEREGDRVTIDGEITIKNEQAVEMHIHNMIMSEISLKQLIIGRASARLGISAHVLMERMVNSFYSKYTGFAKSSRQDDNDEKIYPSRLIYDFDETVAKSEEKSIMNKKEPELAPEVSAKAIEIKNKVIRKIVTKKSLLNQNIPAENDSIDGSNKIIDI